MIFLRRILFVPVVLIVACAPRARVMPLETHSTSSSSLLTREEAGVNGGRRILSVPFFSQTDGLCGPAALAAVLNYWQEGTAVEEIKRAVFLPQLNGTLGFDLARFARSRGFIAKSFTGSLSRLRELLIQGIPSIAFLNLGNRFFPAGHFVVVVGIDDKREEIIVHSGSEANKAVPFRVFVNAWKKTDYWTLQVIPPRPRRAQ
ncbi:MAG: C39 family peptidase [Nitrospiria bacterium]